MVVTMYLDKLVAIGLITEETWEDWTTWSDNLCDVDVPENVLRNYYETLDDTTKTFEDWYENESIADDMDHLFERSNWRPTMDDVFDFWDTMTYKGKMYPVKEYHIKGFGDRLISVESFENALIKDGDYVDDEARAIDEQIFYFVPDRQWNKANLGLYVWRHVNE